MKVFISISLLILVNTTFIYSQLIINEIYPADNSVEIKNIGNQSENINFYWLCNFPDYANVGSLAPYCGVSTIEPGEIKAFNFEGIESQDGELGLYNAQDFGNPNAMVSYVQWGSSGHEREVVATQANLWTQGDFIPTFPLTWSLEYSGSGLSSSDWQAVAVHSRCMENGTGCSISKPSILSNESEYNICVGDGNNDDIDFEIGGKSTENAQLIVTNDNGFIIEITDETTINFEGQDPGICYIRSLVYENEILGLKIGAKLNDLMGCFSVSDSIIINRVMSNVDGGTVSDINGETNFSFCTTDNIDDIIQFATTGNEDSYGYIITNEDNIVIQVLDNEIGVNFEGSGAGVTKIYGASYTGEIIINLGNEIFSTPISDACYMLSTNFINVERNTSGSACTSSIFELSKLDQSIFVAPNPIHNNLLKIKLPLDLGVISIDVILYNHSGKHIKSLFDQVISSEIEIDVDGIEQGIYFLHLKVGNRIIIKKFVKI
jgi:hypothetical protein